MLLLKLAIAPDGEKKSDGSIDFFDISSDFSLCSMAMRAELRSVLRTSAVSMSRCSTGSTKNSRHESGAGALSLSVFIVSKPITLLGICVFDSYFLYKLLNEPQLAAIRHKTLKLNIIVDFFILYWW